MLKETLNAISKDIKLWSPLTDDSDENAASQPEQKSKLKFTD